MIFKCYRFRCLNCSSYIWYIRYNFCTWCNVPMQCIQQSSIFDDYWTLDNALQVSNIQTDQCELTKSWNDTSPSCTPIRRENKFGIHSIIVPLLQCNITLLINVFLGTYCWCRRTHERRSIPLSLID